MASKLHHFERFDAVYKTVGDTDIEAAILVPRTLAYPPKKATCPLMVHFHGGALLSGTILEPAFLSLWSIELALETNSIVVAPAHRLLPEAKGDEILDDIRDFWVWVHSKLASVVSAKWPHITADTSKIAAWGESAGGFLALESATVFSAESKLKVVMAQYPGMFADIAEYDPTPEMLPPGQTDVLDKYLSHIRPGTVRTKRTIPEFTEIIISVLTTGRHRELLGPDPRMGIEHCLNQTKTLAPLWMLQGADDRNIRKPTADFIAQKVRETHPDSPFLYTVEKGDHLLDKDHGLSEPYIAEGLKFVRQYWP